MKAHSAYRNKGYKVDKVEQASGIKNIPFHLINVFMGIVVFLLECQYIGEEGDDESTTQMIKSDLINCFQYVKIIWRSFIYIYK